MTIREIKPKDNAAIERIIRDIFIEFGLPLTGTAHEDPETSDMYKAYQDKNEIYYVVEMNNKVVGGAGIKPLNGVDESVCELQKMYFSPEARGKGYGRILFNRCMETAKSFGYKKCYLESASQLKKAIKLYELNGFEYLNQPLGNTGHFSCGVWMIKEL